MTQEIRSTAGRILGSHYTVTFTPEVLLWLNSDLGKKLHRKIFFKKVENLLEDIQRFGRPKRGRAKTISTVEAPVYTIRLENNQGIRVLFDFATHEGYTDLWILAVSEKKEFQDKLKRSAEHIVHASSFDRLPWEDEDNEMIDLAKCTDEDLAQLTKNARLRFGNLPKKEQKEGWSEEKYENRKRRATIYDFVIPNIIDYSILKESTDFDLPAILKLQDHQKELMDYANDKFLLEGVAGTGKTTILLYRFVNDIKNIQNASEHSLNKILFITHNERLKNDIISSLKLFFPPEEYILVAKRVKTTRELFFEIIGKEKKQDSSNGDEKFSSKAELTRDRFRRMFDKNDIDIDLFWEEYRGILRGYNLRGDGSIVSKKDYNEIGRRRGRIRPSQRDAFYHLAQKRESLAKAGNSSFDFNNSWDSLSLCKEVLAAIEKGDSFQKLECMYVDEVQDLTKAEMEILLLLLNPNGQNRFAVAGDLSQSIQPSSFTWQALSDLIYTILGIKVDKHETLLENFRSTPYLVQAANRILELQDELDHDATPELQRPFAGENTGEPGHVFFADEDKLLDALVRRKLPNAACPILVRDKETRARLQQRLNNSNIITIAQFKGLERRNILLWEPDSGSERVLNLRHNPVRGEFARKREFSDSTALLELRHVFVAFTRARYMMGILSPQNDEAYFMKHLLTLENSGLQDSEIDKMQLFEEELSTDALLEYAREYEESRMFEQAAEAYRNIGDEHKYEHCKGKAALEDQLYDEAIHHLYQASKVEIGIESRNAGVLISEISTEALNSSNKDKRPETIAKILMGSVGLSTTARHRLKAEQDEERGNWNSAANNYIHAGDVDRAVVCIRKVSELNIQTILFIECGKMDLARDSFKRYAEEKWNKKIGVAIALAEKNTVEKIFTGPLESLKRTFREPDIDWAKSLASGNTELLAKVRKKAQSKILDRINSSETQEREVLRLLIKTNNIQELKKRNGNGKWKFIENEATAQLYILQKNYPRAIQSTFDLENSRIQQKLLTSIGKNVHRRNEFLGLYEIISDNQIRIPETLTPKNEFFAKVIAIWIIAESTKIDSKDFHQLRKRMYDLLGTHKQLSVFCIQWSIVLMNFQIRNQTKEITVEQKFELEILINLHETDKRMASDLMLNYALHQEVRTPDNDANLQIIWNRLSPQDRGNFHVSLALGSPDSLIGLPNYLEIQGEIERYISMFRLHDPEAKAIEREVKREIKYRKREFKRHLSNLIKLNQGKLRGVFRNSLREIFSLPPIVYLATGKHETGTSNQIEGAPLTTTPTIQQPPKENTHPEETKSTQEVKIDEPIVKVSQPIVEEEGEEELLLSDFVTDDGTNDTSKFFDGLWEELCNTEPSRHLVTAKGIIKAKQIGNYAQQRSHLLECVDECLLTDVQSIQSHHKFVVILAIKELAREIELTSELIDVLPQSTLESIRLFKEQNKTEILKSGVPYFMQVLN